MKLRFILFVAALNAVLLSSSMPIGESDAQSIAQSFVRGNSARFSKGVQPGATATVTLAYTSPGSELRVFNVSSEGFVVVAGDDCVESVLGYSDEGEFVYSELPDNARWWFEETARSISILAEQGQAQSVKANVVATRAIKPLLKSKWNQTNPFNFSCPTYTKNGTTYRAVTGCVATAMAQVMRYHEWPSSGTGSHSYTFAMNNDSTDMRTLSSQFSSHTYNWSQMPYEAGSTTTTQQTELAQLCLDCGISTEISYGSSSGTPAQIIVPALTTHFGYDGGMKVLFRNCYTLTGWKEQIFSELSSKRPVIYAGQSNSGGGHAFVIDGCDTNDYYHINWGWSGKSNGYFLFTDLNPSLLGTGGGSGAYNYSQRIITGIRPDAGSAAALSVSATTFTTTEATKPVSSSYTQTITIKSLHGIAAKSYTPAFYVCLAVYNSSGSVVQRSSNAYFSTKPKYNYTRSFAFSPSTSLANGTYYIKPQYTTNGSTYTLLPLYLTTSQYIKMTISNGQVTYTPQSTTPTLKAMNISLSGTAYVGRKALVKATIYNSGAHYTGNIYAAWANTSITSTPVVVDLATGESQQVEFIVDGPASSGTRAMYFYDNDKSQISGSSSYAVQAAPADPKLTIASQLAVGASVMPAEKITASASITNSGGVFTGQLQAFVLASTGGSILSIFTTPFLTIPASSTATISFAAPFENGVEGSPYRIVLRDPTSTSYTTWGNFAYFTIGTPSKQCDVNGDGQVTVNDVTCVYNVILGIDNTYQSTADVNGDGQVTVTDVTAIYDAILGL